MEQSKYYCGTGLTIFYGILHDLRKALESKCEEKIKEAKAKLEEFRQLCGSPLDDSEIKRLIGNDLDSTDLSFLRNAPQAIIRSIESEDIEGAEIILKGFGSYIKPKITRMPEGFRAILDVFDPIESYPEQDDPHHNTKAQVISGFRNMLDSVERSSDFKEILAKNFNREESNFKAKMIPYQQQKQFLSFIPRTPRESTQPTNAELQEQYKKRKQEDNEF